MGEFGDKFRKAREKKELSLDDVSNVTKISSRMLQAIEEEHFDLLPGGVFNKGFIRAYAKHLGLNDEDAVTDYLTCLRQAQVDAQEVWEPQPASQPRPAAPERRRASAPNPPAEKPQPPEPVEELPELQLPRAEDVRPRRKEFADRSSQDVPWSLVAVAALIVVLGIVLLIRRSHHENAAVPTTPVKTAQAASAPASVAPVNPSSAPASTATPSAQPSTQPSAAPAKATHPPADAAEDTDKNDVTVRNFPASNAKPAPTSTRPLTLVIRATETSWISVLADGQTASQETLIAPAHVSIRANREIVARIGNAAGVTFLWNGQEVPAEGAEAEVKTFVFDSNGMRVLPTAAPAAQNH